MVASTAKLYVQSHMRVTQVIKKKKERIENEEKHSYSKHNAKSS